MLKISAQNKIRAKFGNDWCHVLGAIKASCIFDGLFLGIEGAILGKFKALWYFKQNYNQLLLNGVEELSIWFDGL